MLTIHRSERADRLVDALAAILLEPLDDPFEPEVIAVPTRGVERWITQRLSTMLGTSPGRQDGVCANVAFPFPGRLVASALATATGVDAERDPWSPERAVWPLLATVEDHLGDEWLAPLAAHLGGASPKADESRRDRRFGVVRHLADLFDHYSHHRPEMITAWAAGDDTDGRGSPLPHDLLWQTELWRQLRDRIGTDSPAERLGEACERLRGEPGLVDLPARLALFGLTRLAASHAQVLDALGTARDVHLFVLHPSPELWTSVAGHVRPEDAGPLPRRRDDRTASLPHNPLLATWGRDARELQLVVGPRAAADIHHPVASEDGTLLRRLQSDIRADRAPPGAPLPGAVDARMSLDPTDRSVQVHSCHGRWRQVEVLRDALLHLLADDPTLEPRDVIVMCPDIEAFAPLIHATFGSGEVDDETQNLPDVAASPDLRVRLADRSLRQTNAVLGVVADLLALADSRMKATDVVDLASRDPVRRRFGLDDDDLARIDEWVAAAGIRWGFDAAHRLPFQLDGCAENTWRAGLDRLLLGVTMAEEELRLVDGVLPLDDVDSGDIDLVGRLSELIARLDSAAAALRDPQPIGSWVDAIASAADALTATSQRDAWQRDEVTRLLDALVDESTSTDVPLALAEVRSLLADRLKGRPTRANFRTGHLTVCTLVPMRSVPHRVVCLLGLDDGSFPRRTTPDGDDIIERDPCVGDRDVRSEDRQLLLDAVLSATDHLVVTYCGRNERTNAELPPAVPLGELLDVIDATARSETGKARRLVVIEHPLQTFDDRNFGAGTLVSDGDRPWSFDTVALEGALARRHARRVEPPFLPDRLAPLDDPLVEVDDLVRFVQHPVKTFLRRRLGVLLSADEEEPDEGMPVQLDGLMKWAIGQRLVENLLAGHSRDECIAAERARGALPPGMLGDAVLNEVVPLAEEIVAAATSVVNSAQITSVEVEVTLPDGKSLVGTVNDVVGDVLRVVTYSRVAPKHRLAAWVRLLALTAAHPHRPFSAATVGRGHRGVGVATIGPLGADVAAGHLAVLLDLHARGMREPLPLYCDTSAAYAAAPSGGRIVRAREKWTTPPFGAIDQEDRDAAHVLVLGDEISFDDVEIAVPAVDESGPGWHDEVSSRFGRYALRLWEALYTLERAQRAVSLPDTFDVCGPLPSGVTLLEASAGTGKTFTIAALAARYVAEGTPLEHLLLVTFGRMATGELRDRVRERLVTAERGLAHAIDGVTPIADDEVLTLLAAAPDAEVERRRRRLAAALADFDAATIATTHRFCQQVLTSLGVAADFDADATFVEDPTDLIEEVVDDLYVRKFRLYSPPFGLDEALRIGKAAVFNPGAVLVPMNVDPATEPAMRRRLAVAVIDEFERRKRRQKLVTYDDLLTRLADTLGDPESGPAAQAALRHRYQVALVDEFQDTDPTQWEIVRSAFGGGDTTLVLIGDPKQAIYAFRGADVYAYLDAAASATTQATLGVNWRSDQALIDAYDALMGGSRLGHAGIEYRTVRAADDHQQPRLRGAPEPAALRVRILHRDDGLVALTQQQKWAAVDSARRVIAADVAGDVVALLSSGAEVVVDAAQETDGHTEAVRPGHVAVLVSRNEDAATVRDALDAAGVPAVINGAGSVFLTPVARDWKALLEALERPSSTTRVRALALSVFVGWSAARVATADDAAWEVIYDRVHRGADVLRRRGVAALLESITHSERLPARLLRRADGERTLTDLRHIGQLLHSEAVAGGLGVTALASWLRRRIAEADQDIYDENRSRRLESDSEAVQVLTIHRSKGLEFPIVYCPFLWQGASINRHDLPVFHDPANGGRQIDVGGKNGPDFASNHERYVEEKRGEELRMAYVALTRARHQAVVWWATSSGSRDSALARLLFSPDGSVLATPPSEEKVVTRVNELAAQAPGSIAVERCSGGTGVRWSPAASPAAELDVRTFDRTIDSWWRRLSYTGLTAGIHEVDVGSEPEQTGITDEQLPAAPAAEASGSPAEPALRAVQLPLAAMPGGTRVGSLVHAVFEGIDFVAADLADTIGTALAERLAWSRVDIGPVGDVAAGLAAAIETPLGPLAREARLRDVGRADRLDELGFELPLVGGDAPTADLTLRALADVLDAHVGAGDPLEGYPARLRDPLLRPRLRGFLNGSLDLVLRLDGDGGTPRFAVVDYKTNWLGVEGEELTAWHYRPDSLRNAMHRAHYPLQALFYVVALHRYLRWRLLEYRPEDHLAGVLYLFLRGMTGGDVPRVDGHPCGVFSWAPRPELVVAVSDLLDTGVPER